MNAPIALFTLDSDKPGVHSIIANYTPNNKSVSIPPRPSYRPPPGLPRKWAPDFDAWLELAISKDDIRPLLTQAYQVEGTRFATDGYTAHIIRNTPPTSIQPDKQIKHMFEFLDGLSNGSVTAGIVITAYHLSRLCDAAMPFAKQNAYTMHFSANGSLEIGRASCRERV